MSVATEFTKAPMMTNDEGGAVIVSVRDEAGVTGASVRLVLSVESY